MNENNLETVSSLSTDLSKRENITIQLEELLIAGNYDEAKLLLEPSQPVDIADAIGSLPQILQALAFRLLKKNEAIEVYEYLDPVVQQTYLWVKYNKPVIGFILQLVETYAIIWVQPMTILKSYIIYYQININED